METLCPYRCLIDASICFPDCAGTLTCCTCPELLSLICTKYTFGMFLLLQNRRSGMNIVFFFTNSCNFSSLVAIQLIWHKPNDVKCVEVRHFTSFLATARQSADALTAIGSHNSEFHAWQGGKDETLDCVRWLWVRHQFHLFLPFELR